MSQISLQIRTVLTERAATLMWNAYLINNNFQSPLIEVWDEDEEPAAAETELDSGLSDCLQSFQLLTLALTVLKLC